MTMLDALPASDVGHGELTLVLMHSFGSSGREWDACGRILSADHRCLALDLPGHGRAAAVEGYSVDAMRRAVLRTLEQHGVRRYVLVGHSMSGKVATALAAERPEGLAGLVMVSPSPPSPEPIKDADRQRMLAMDRRRADAESFLDNVTASPLEGATRDAAIDDFLACSPAAWRAWLEHGSNEDWAARVGRIDCPALVLVGDRDPAMPKDVHERLTLPHLADAQLQVLPGCGHLPPREMPGQLADTMGVWLARRLSAKKE